MRWNGGQSQPEDTFRNTGVPHNQDRGEGETAQLAEILVGKRRPLHEQTSTVCE